MGGPPGRRPPPPGGGGGAPDDDRVHRPHRRHPQGRPRGDSIIFDPTSFLMGGIHKAWDID